MCEKFTELSTEEKAKKIESVGGCALCTSFQHKRDQCNQEQRSCGLSNGSSPCTKLHHKMLHGTRTTYVNFARFSRKEPKEVDANKKEKIEKEMKDYQETILQKSRIISKLEKENQKLL